MSSGTNSYSGSFTGTGAAIDVQTPPFKPSRVDLFNVSGLCKAHWTQDMPDASMMKQITAGTISNVTANGVTPLANGFRLGADADLNVSGEVVHFTCFQ